MAEVTFHVNGRESTTITSSYCVNPIVVARNGSVVYLKLQGFKNITNKTTANVGVLPSGCRPASTTVFNISLYTGSTTENFRVTLEAGGSIGLYAYNGVTAIANLTQSLMFLQF